MDRLWLVGVLLGVVASAGASAAASRPDLATAPERISIEGTVVPLDLSQGRPMVEVFIEGAGPFRMVFDTGGVGLMIDAELAEELALPIVGEGRVSSPMGASEGLPVQQARIDRMRLGGASLEHLVVDIWDFESLFRGEGAPKGIFGITLLRDLLVTLDLAQGRLEIKTGSLVANSPDVVEIDLDQGLPVLAVDVAGVPIAAHLDSGNAQALLLPHARSTEVPLASPLSLAGRGRTVDAVFEVYRAEVAGPVSLAGHELGSPNVHFVKGAALANVGVDFLRQLVITFDLRRRLAKIQPVEPHESVALGGEELR